MVNKNKEKYEELEKIELNKKKKADDYDVLVKSLQFDSKAKVILQWILSFNNIFTLYLILNSLQINLKQKNK